MVIDNMPAQMNGTRALAIKRYIDGNHKVDLRKDFHFKNQKFETAKIKLQSIKSIIDFHSTYLCGNPITLRNDENKLKLVNSIYKKGLYQATDYQIAKNIYTYGNAFEYVYRDNKGVIKSKIIRNEDGYPIYDSNGDYQSFIESWVNNTSNCNHEIVYTNDKVFEYVDDKLIGEYNNPSGLPIHYTSGEIDDSGYFGLSLTNDLIPIMNEIEMLLSKMSDSVNTLSLNPLGISIGDRVEATVDKDITGAILNIEAGGEFKWATAQLDDKAINTILENLINQYYTIAQVPSVLYGNSNVANVSEVSLKLLFNCADSLAKKSIINLLNGLNQRMEYISRLVGVDLTDTNFSFNLNRPVDNTSVINDIKTQVELGIMSIETAMTLSPYINDVEYEVKNVKLLNK